jgi:prepilin-type processing-associated H-X9-DG protein
MNGNDYNYPANSTVRVMQITSYLCPSDNNVPLSTVTVSGVSKPKNYTNYVNNIGTWRGNNGKRFDGPAYTLGDSSLGGTITIAAIKDGASNTAIFSEFIRGRNVATAGGLQAIYKNPTDAYAGAASQYPLAQLGKNCDASTVLFSGTKGIDWMSQNCGEGDSYSHIQTPNKQSCVFNDDTSTHTDHCIVGASSNHGGGVNLVLLDGSVRFIKSSISQQTWWALATHKGGETIDAASF